MNRLIGIVALGVVAGGLSACGSGEDRARRRQPSRSRSPSLLSRRSTRPSGSKPAASSPHGNPHPSRVESSPRLPAYASRPETGFALVTC